ncbi:MAG: mannonate dehydratase [Ginsengibacter sp.]
MKKISGAKKNTRFANRRSRKNKHTIEGPEAKNLTPEFNDISNVKANPESSNTSTIMARREFARVIAAGVIVGGITHSTKAANYVASTMTARKKNTLHHVGGDYHCVMGDHWTSKENFEFHQRYGVRHLTNIMRMDEWDIDEMKRWKDLCDKNVMIWEAIRMDSSYIYLPPGPGRDRKIEEIIDHIKIASQVGVKVITMHWTLIPIRRNLKTPGRGGSSYASFKLEDNWKELPPTSHGVVSYKDYWERITYFLKSVIPIAQQYDVRMAIHPYDPPGLPRGYQGVDNWDAAPSTVLESLQRYEAIIDSPYNGFQLCLGTCMEGLKNPGTELLPIVRYFAGKGKIHQIHMRNIRGGLHNFQEVFIDEGEANFIEVIRILRDSEFAWSICPDHVQRHPDDPNLSHGFAHGFGYIQALIDCANSEV